MKLKENRIYDDRIHSAVLNAGTCAGVRNDIFVCKLTLDEYAAIDPKNVSLYEFPMMDLIDSFIDLKANWVNNRFEGACAVEALNMIKGLEAMVSKLKDSLPVEKTADDRSHLIKRA